MADTPVEARSVRDRFIDGLPPQLLRAECKRLMEANAGLRAERDAVTMKQAVTQVAARMQPYTDAAMCAVAMAIGGVFGFVFGVFVR